MLRLKSFCAVLLGLAAALPLLAETPPLWVTNPTEVYAEDQYVTALETGDTRKEAEVNAFEALAAIFNRSIRAETKTAVSIHDTKSGSDKTKKIQKEVAVSTKMDNLVGAEIKEVWKDSDGTHYALAVLNKAKAVSLYRESIRKNTAAIAELTTLSDSEKYSLSGYCRYSAARVKAVENEALMARLVFLNAGAAALTANEAVSAASLQLACTAIAKEIPITLAITGDESGKLKAAFSQIFAAQGFTVSSAQTGRYRLNAALTMEEPIPQGSNKVMVRYAFESSLEDSSTGEMIIPFTVKGREIHFNQASAESKLLITVEKKIKTEFAKRFTAYLQIQ